MNQLASVLLLALLINVSFQAEYDQDLAIEFMQISAMAYCPENVIEDFACGQVCDNLRPHMKYVHYYQQEASSDNSLSFSMFRDDTNGYFITAFRGTNTHWQLFVEGAEGDDTEYGLYDIPQATVTAYFYNHYTQYLRSDFLSQLRAARSQYPSYTYVFTGHSLGAALTTHAALDAVLGGMVPSRQVMMYNYGSPRVGNLAFATKVVNSIPTIFRVVHWQDLVPHVPPCAHNWSGNCVTDDSDSDYSESGKFLYPAWHIWPQIFYNEDMTSYQTCGAEDPDCANQFSAVSLSIADHLDYFGTTTSCSYHKPSNGGNSGEGSGEHSYNPNEDSNKSNEASNDNNNEQSNNNNEQSDSNAGEATNQGNQESSGDNDFNSQSSNNQEDSQASRNQESSNKKSKSTSYFDN